MFIKSEAQDRFGKEYINILSYGGIPSFLKFIPIWNTQNKGKNMNNIFVLNYSVHTLA